MSSPKEEANQTEKMKSEKQNSSPVSIFDPQLSVSEGNIEEAIAPNQDAFDQSPAIYGVKGNKQARRLNPVVPTMSDSKTQQNDVKPEGDQALKAAPQTPQAMAQNVDVDGQDDVSSEMSPDLSGLLSSDHLNLSSPNLLQLEEREATLEAREAYFVKQVDKYRSAIQEVKQRLKGENKRLEEWAAQLEVRQAKLASSQNQQPDSGNLSEKEALLEEFKESLKAKAEELQQQFDVVKRERRQFADLERQRELLNEVKRAMAANETEMLKKWAPTKGVVLVANLMCLIVALGLASWFVTNELVKPEWRATALMRFAEEEAEAPAEVEQWLDDKKGFILSEGPLKAVYEALGKYDQRELFADTVELNQALNDGMSLAYVAPRSIHLAYESTDDEAAGNILAAVSEGFVRYTSNSKDFATIEKHASLDKNPTKDDRMQFAGMGFGVSFLVVMLVWILVKNIFLKSASTLAPKMQQLIDLLENASQPQLAEEAARTTSPSSDVIDEDEFDDDI